MKTSVRAKFRLAFAGLALGPLLALGILVVTQSYHFQLDQAVLRQGDICYAAGLKVEQFFHSLDRHLFIFLDLVNLKELDRSRRDEALAGLLFHKSEAHGSLFAHMALLDPGGQVLGCASPQGDCPESDDFKQRIDLKEVLNALSSRPNFAGPVFFDPVSGSPRMIVALPLHEIRSGRLWSILCAEVRLKELWQLVDWMPQGVHVKTYLLDRQNRVIAHPDPSVVLRGTRFEAPFDPGVTRGLAGGKVVMASAPIIFGGQSFRVVIERPLDEVLAATRRLAWLLGGLVMAAVALVVAMGLWTQRHIVRPIEAVAQSARRLGGGDLSRRIDQTRADELGDLAAAFNAMADDLAQTITSLERENRERMVKEEALSEEKRFSEDLIASMPGVFYHFDNQGRFLHWNRNFGDITGYADPEIAGIRPTDVIAPEDRKTVAASIDRVFREGRATVEADLLTKAGRRIPYLFTGRMFSWGERRELVGVGMDLSRRKEAEQALQAYTRRLERANVELEQFALISSHHLQEPIRKIINFADLLMRDLEGRLSPDAQRYLRYLDDGARRMKRLIEDLMALIQLDRVPAETQAADVEEVIGQALQELGDRVRASGAIVTWDPMPTLQTDRARLKTVLRHLIANAVTFQGPEAPRVHISVQEARGASGEKGPEEAAETERTWAFRITDNGMGIDPAYHGRIFGVFERLHPVGQYPGTGMGLALCQKIVEQAGGRIWVASQPGQGATFHFTLPG